MSCCRSSNTSVPHGSVLSSRNKNTEIFKAEKLLLTSNKDGHMSSHTVRPTECPIPREDSAVNAGGDDVIECFIKPQ